MNLYSLLVAEAQAQAAAPATRPAGGVPAFLIQMAPLALMFLVFYFLLIRPQQQKQRALAAKVSAMQKGDEVVTSGGMIGKIWAIKEDRVVVKVGDTPLEFLKSAIVDVTKAGT